MRVIVVDHDSEWDQLFQEEAKKIKELFGEELVDIHHIGSTSVPGLQAKPILDMMPVVRDIQKVEFRNEQMEDMGYEALGEFGTPRRRYFRKGGDARTHQVQFYQADDTYNVDRHLAVKNFLRTHPDEARRYGELKASLANKYPNDSSSYVEGKSSFIKNLEEKALSWYETE
ncbi:GrpB family protein [Sporosarcina jeotgali]|uniref:GrpB family protein n=1 Tax=Sporosarcina jeotgali TaxID=3020056 RepID=A0ABZ0KTA0_9BACL|nr:GrpB family protein [Sporosarcina sp. B2O-1]WOV83028.1 GrpB family protein [Sporosarcina sp. B2O-1]